MPGQYEATEVGPAIGSQMLSMSEQSHSQSVVQLSSAPARELPMRHQANVDNAVA
jgi:hypothetical protein